MTPPMRTSRACIRPNHLLYRFADDDVGPATGMRPAAPGRFAVPEQLQAITGGATSPVKPSHSMHDYPLVNHGLCLCSACRAGLHRRPAKLQYHIRNTRCQPGASSVRLPHFDASLLLDWGSFVSATLGTEHQPPHQRHKQGRVAVPRAADLWRGAVSATATGNRSGMGAVHELG